jgi:predicted DNA-binding transcriptional regulator YafY
VHQGTAPETIELEFDERIARYVKERVWHPSQTVRDLPGGGLAMTLRVSNDWALRSWILGFGQLARVVSPPGLAAQLLDELDRARSLYVPRLE